MVSALNLEWVEGKLGRMKCATYNCEREPEFDGEAGWIQHTNLDRSYWCPLCAQKSLTRIAGGDERISALTNQYRSQLGLPPL